MTSAGVPNLYIRGGIYYVLKSVGGRDRKASTRVQAQDKDGLKRAIKRQAEIEQQWDEEAQGKLKVPTFREWAQTLETLRQGKDAEETLKQRRLAVENAQLFTYQGKSFVDYLLDQITPVMAESYLVFRATQLVRNLSADQAVASGKPRKQKRKALSATTVQKERQQLQGIIGAAIDRRVVVLPHGNPFAHIERMKRQDTVREGVVSHDAEPRLRQGLIARHQRWLTFMLWTGLRVNEARYVRPEHINREARELQVLGSILVEGKKINVAKRGKARKVPLYPEAIQAVDEQLQETPGELWPVTGGVMAKALKRAARKAQIGRVTPHTLRHTFGTRYLQAGGNIYILSKILGHASVQVTELHYAHVVPQDVVKLSLGLQLKPLTASLAA